MAWENEKAIAVLPKPLILRVGNFDRCRAAGIQTLTDIEVRPPFVTESLWELDDPLVDLTKEGLIAGRSFAPRVDVVDEALLPKR